MLRSSAKFACACLLLSAVCAFSQEKRVTREQLPAAVRKAADAQAQGATVHGYSKDVENGRTEYEVELVVNGHSKDVTLSPDGAVVEIEEQVELEALSPSAQAGLLKFAKAAKVTKIESITRHGKLIAYEAQLSDNGKHSEIQVSPDGSHRMHAD